MAKPTIPLTVLPGRAADAHVVKAPPVVELGTENDYACGSCGTVLLRANAGQVHNVLFECSRCRAQGRPLRRRALRRAAQMKGRGCRSANS